MLWRRWFAHGYMAPDFGGGGVAVEVEGGATGRISRRDVAIVIATMFGVGVGFGAAVPLMSLRLNALGAEPWLIGLNAAMGPLAVIIAGPILPRLIQRFGAISVMWVGLLFGIAMTLPLPFVPPLPWWLPLRFVVGMSIAAQWIAAEVWLNVGTNLANRGLVMSTYASVFVGGFAIGPLLLLLTGTEGVLPFLLITGAIATSVIPLSLGVSAAGKAATRALPAERPADLAALLSSPLLVVAAFASGAADMSIITHLPVHALKHGVEKESVAAIVGIFVLGNALLQIPIGWLADKVGRIPMLIFCALGGFIGALILPAALAAGWLVWPMMLLWGACVFGVYTVSVSLLGDRFAGGQVAAANTVFIIIYEIGSSLGPVGAGFAMQAAPDLGLVAVLAGLNLVIIAACFIRSRR